IASELGELAASRNRKPSSHYFADGNLAAHDPAGATGLGLDWGFPIADDNLMGLEYRDLGGAYCPTLKGRERGSWSHRYNGIHRGHDLGVTKTRLLGRKVPVHAIADGIYDGQRIYTHAKAMSKDCKPLVVYHSSGEGGDEVYTSIYCHVDPLPDLKPGQKLHVGDIIGTLEDPEGSWGAHVHLALYSRPVYSSKDSTKFSRCGCKSNADCDAKVRQTGEIARGCGIFEDDLYLLESVKFIERHSR
ncbi:M23 family metallopeptidase, partial [Elusimicrobiota bacterium]